MNAKWLKVAAILVTFLLLLAPSCWAKAKGYCFVVGYTYKLKKMYCTPVFMVTVRDVSYSDKEWVADMELIRKMEAQFQRHIARVYGETPSAFTIAARGAFKNQTFAVQDLTKEKEQYAKKGFEVLDLTNFRFSN